MVHRPSRLKVHFTHSVGRLFYGSMGKVEGLDAIGSLMPPIGENAPQYLNGRPLVAIRSVMIVNARIELDASCPP